METKYINFKENSNNDFLIEAGSALRSGKLVIFPTETVYGIGANGLDETAVKRIFEAKGRNPDNPLILHIVKMSMLDTIAQNISTVERKLINAFFPGPFTIILNKKSIVPNAVTAGLDTVAVRMPSNSVAKELILSAGVPIAAPSANISGKPSGTNIEDIKCELMNKVEYIIDDGPCNIGLESTVVRVIDGVPTILRPGKITAEEIKEVAGSVKIDKNVFEKCSQNTKVLSPGMKYRHYAPNTKCVLVYSPNNDNLVAKINELVEETPNSLVISCLENADSFHSKYVFNIGQSDNLEEISKNVFSTLRKVDAYHVDLIIIQGVAQVGLGLAIMNRLLRACEYNYIEC